ncbi:hypothetical protein VNO80_06775 [Phaseolus coccineus]|uniref:Phosphoenolpyruvate carboxylase n=1 Tax=Phaseolus coccineus TaxID=3886 RepID=A0AAN9RJ04_PHACN
MVMFIGLTYGGKAADMWAEVLRCINNGTALLKERTFDAAVTALELLSKALSIRKPLPLTCIPKKFGSWMGGDRDGNPNVTTKVTKDVSLLSRWMAIDLYIREVDNLKFELTMNQCSDRLSRLAHDILENGESQHPRLDIPGPDYMQSNHKVQFPDYDISDTAIAY